MLNIGKDAIKALVRPKETPLDARTREEKERPALADILTRHSVDNPVTVRPTEMLPAEESVSKVTRSSTTPMAVEQDMRSNMVPLVERVGSGEMRDAMSELLALLTSGDAKSALETLDTLQRIVERESSSASVGSSKSSETREGKAMAVETASQERGAALEKLTEQREKYMAALQRIEAQKREMAALQERMQELEALQEQAAALQKVQTEARALAQQEETLAAAKERINEAEALKRGMKEIISRLEGVNIDHLKEDVLKNYASIEPALSLEESGMGQSFKRTMRELWDAKEVRPVTEDAVADVKALAEQFATDPETEGYLTSAQADFLAAKLLTVPFVSEYSFGQAAHAQVSGELVKAAMEGFEAAGLPEKSLELMAAQLAHVAYATADSVYVDTTLPGNGKEALEAYVRSGREGSHKPFLELDGPLPDDAAAPTYVHARSFGFIPGSETRVEAIEQMEALPDQPGRYGMELRVSPTEKQEMPMLLTVRSYQNRGSASVTLMAHLYEISRLDNGDLQVSVRTEREIVTGEGVGLNGDREQAWAWKEPSKTFTVPPYEDGSFDLPIAFDGSESVDPGSSFKTYVNEAADDRWVATRTSLMMNVTQT